MMCPHARHVFVSRNVASELRAAAERGAGRCVIACGHRAVGAGEEILKLAERIHAPVLTRGGNPVEHGCGEYTDGCYCSE